MLLKITFLVYLINYSITKDLEWRPLFCDRTTEFCGFGETHIACNKNNWQIRCLKPKTRVYTIPDEARNGIESKINSLRERVASGKLEPFLKAHRMGTVIWDEQLSHISQLQCNTCEFTYDACYNLPSYPSAGKLVHVVLNLKEIYSEGNIHEFVFEAIDAWFSTHKYATKILLAQHSRAGYRHEAFATLMIESNTRFGCAVLYYELHNWHRYVLFCNFATKCINFHPIYVPGDPASGCTTGKNPAYPSLCSVDEEYKYQFVDNYYS